MGVISNNPNGWVVFHGKVTEALGYTPSKEECKLLMVVYIRGGDAEAAAEQLKTEEGRLSMKAVQKRADSVEVSSSAGEKTEEIEG